MSCLSLLVGQALWLLHQVLRFALLRHFDLVLVQSGRVFEGDEIVSLNGQDLTAASYRQAAQQIKAIPDGVMQLTLRSNPQVWPGGLRNIPSGW